MGTRPSKPVLHRHGPAHVIDYLRQSIRTNPDDADLRLCLGRALFKGGALREAAHLFRSVLAIEPDDTLAAHWLVSTLELLGDRDEIVGAWTHYARNLSIHDRLEEAIVASRRALARKPDCLKALMGLGHAYHALGQPREAIRYYEAAVAINPSQARAHLELGRAFHHVGDHERGWAGFARLYSHEMLEGRGFEQPVWDGRTDLSGKTILVWEGFGLGDAIFFLRFVPYLHARGAKVVFEGSRLLEPLFAPLSCVDRFIPRGTPLPNFDLHAPLGLLPSLIEEARTQQHESTVPYIQVDQGLREEWRARLARSHELTVGIVWAGDPRHATARYRTIPLAEFGALAGAANVRLVSLQYGRYASEASTPPADVRLDIVLDSSCTIADTAAIIQNLDLVVTVDTMVAHLSGALGVHVWTMLARTAAWMWRATGSRTHWYPTMRLFRQTTPGDWSTVLAEVAVELEAAARGRGLG
jgi:Tetratricopeptide repeat